MQELTGIPAFEWMLALCFATAGALVVGSVFWRSRGTRFRGVLVVPLVVGAVGIAIVAIAFRADAETLLADGADRTAGLAVAALVLFMGAAVADLLVSRVARFVAAAGLGPDTALLVALVIPAVLGLVGLVKLDERTLSAVEAEESVALAGATVEADHVLPGQPVDVVMRTPSDGYVTFEDGRVARLVLDGDGDVDLDVVATGLASPRGVAVLGDSLVVAELGPLPCAESFPCKGENVDAASTKDGERRILRESNGRLVRFQIGPDGSLSDRRVILDRLPVANTDHGVNAVTAGPDGRLYVSIGNLDRLAVEPLRNPERARPNVDYLGTVLSLRPDGRALEVVARGLRNVYDLTFDDEGRLYGVDNEGESRRGMRLEEVLEIVPGADYGFPEDGTFAPHTRRTAPPLWLLDTAGSAGVEWLRLEGQPTLLVGSCGDVHAVELDEIGKAATVTNGSAVRHLLSVPGCVTAIEPLGDDRVLLTLFTFDEEPRLYVVRVDR